MSKIKIVTDSTAYIDKSFIEKHNVDVVPLSIGFEGSVEDEGFPEILILFDRIIKTSSFSHNITTSSRQIIEVFENALEDGYKVIAIIMSSKLEQCVW